MLLLLDNYDSFTYNLYALFKLQGAEIEVFRENEEVDLDRYRGVVVSPGPSSPENMKGSLKKVRSVIGVKPVFGVCLGMQMIAYILGATIARARTIQHGKVDNIKKVKDSFILRGIPDVFKAVRYHSLAVRVNDSPFDIVALSEKDGEIMAIENRQLKVFGVQFHPESILSEFGDVIARNFMEVCYGS